MQSRQRRALRAAAASSVGTVLAAVSHTVGGGSAPAPWLVGTVLLLSLPVCLILVGRRLGLPGLTAAVLAAQGLLHVLFSVMGDAPAGTGLAGTHVHSLSALPALGATVAASTTAEMVLAHVVAALGAVLLLRRGEQALAALLRWARALLARRLPVTVPVASSTPARHLVPRAHRAARAAAPFRRRGPPLAVR